ncbi:MAG TPA: DNA-binding protein [Cyanobacteria bacterium UBA11372]|nr:DNA-binding protein [Cyanobacteria bacterium UBA11372]
MIKNDQQYKFTQHLAERFQKSIAAMDRDEERKKNDPDGWELLRSASQCHLDKLQAEIAEYEMLISHDSHTPIVLELDNLYYLPQILIKARIAAKLSEKELGALTGLTEEQIKSYEHNDYENASYVHVGFVMDALDIKIKKCEFLIPLDTLRRKPFNKEDFLSSSQKNKQ